MVGPIWSRRSTEMRLCCDFCDPGKTGHVCEGDQARRQRRRKAPTCTPRYLHCGSELRHKCEIRCISWAIGARKSCKVAHVLRRLQTATPDDASSPMLSQVERVEDGIQMAPRITNLRQAREAAGREMESSPSQCWGHESVININMNALTLFPLVQQLPLSIRYQAYREIPVSQYSVENRIARSFDDQPSFA